MQSLTAGTSEAEKQEQTAAHRTQARSHRHVHTEILVSTGSVLRPISKDTQSIHNADMFTMQIGTLLACSTTFASLVEHKADNNYLLN